MLTHYFPLFSLSLWLLFSFPPPQVSLSKHTPYVWLYNRTFWLLGFFFLLYCTFSSLTVVCCYHTNCVLHREHDGHTVSVLHSGRNYYSLRTPPILDSDSEYATHININKWCHLADVFSCLNVGKAPLGLSVLQKWWSDKAVTWVTFSIRHGIFLVSNLDMW